MRRGNPAHTQLGKKMIKALLKWYSGTVIKLNSNIIITTTITSSSNKKEITFAHLFDQKYRRNKPCNIQQGCVNRYKVIVKTYIVIKDFYF